MLGDVAGVEAGRLGHPGHLGDRIRRDELGALFDAVRRQLEGETHTRRWLAARASRFRFDFARLRLAARASRLRSRWRVYFRESFLASWFGGF